MENTTENNKLIAEFMEIKLFKNSKEFKSNYPKTFKKQAKETQYKTLYIMNEGKNYWFTMPLSGFRYHSFWDWLMPVVEKINQTGASVIIGRMFCEIRYINPLDSTKTFDVRIASGVKINAINGAIVEFIKWYNQQQK